MHRCSRVLSSLKGQPRSAKVLIACSEQLSARTAGYDVGQVQAVGQGAPREVPLPKEELVGALAASADRVPNADLLLLAAKDAKALPEGAAGSSAQHACQLRLIIDWHSSLRVRRREWSLQNWSPKLALLLQAVKYA